MPLPDMTSLQHWDTLDRTILTCTILDRPADGKLGQYRQKEEQRRLKGKRKLRTTNHIRIRRQGGKAEGYQIDEQALRTMINCLLQERGGNPECLLKHRSASTPQHHAAIASNEAWLGICSS